MGNVPQDYEKLVERLNRKIESAGAWMTSDLRAFYTELRDALEASQARVKKLEEALGLSGELICDLEIWVGRDRRIALADKWTRLNDLRTTLAKEGTKE